MVDQKNGYLLETTYWKRDLKRLNKNSSQKKPARTPNNGTNK